MFTTLDCLEIRNAVSFGNDGKMGTKNEEDPFKPFLDFLDMESISSREHGTEI